MKKILMTGIIIFCLAFLPILTSATTPKNIVPDHRYEANSREEIRKKRKEK